MDLSQSDWKYVDERAGAFVGREWVFARVRSFLSGPPGTFLVRGDPGTGKTAVAARLAQASCGRLDTADLLPPVGGGAISAGVFCRAGKATVAELAQRLSDQLAASVDGFADALRTTAEPGTTIRDIHVDVRGDVHAGATVAGVVLSRQDGKQAFSTGVAVPLRHLRERGAAEPIVLLVDAVDEAADVGEVNIFSRLLANLDDVHVIVTCRPDPAVLSDFRAASHKLDLIADAPADDDDVRRYIRNRLTGKGPEEAVNVLAGRVSGEAAGNFLYAFYVTGTLIGSGALAGMDEKTAHGMPLPTGGLAGVYEDFLDRQIAGDQTRWAGELRPVLAPLAVAQDEGLTTEQLRLVANRIRGEPMTRTAIREVTRTARQFLDGPAPDGPFRVYHQSFADFLVDPEQNPDFLIDAAETHEAIVAAYAATDPLSWDSYARRNLALHASEAGQLDHLLEDARFLLAADPARLVPYLDAARSGPARAAAAVYRENAHLLAPLDAPMRASQLELAARQAGADDLAEQFSHVEPSRPWSTRWALWRPQVEHFVARQHRGWVSALAKAECSGQPVVASAGNDKEVCVWNALDGVLAFPPLRGANAPLYALAVSSTPETEVIVAASQDGTLHAWTLDEGRLCWPDPLPIAPDSLYALAPLAIGETPAVVAAGADGVLRVIDVRSGKHVIPAIGAHAAPVAAVAVTKLRGAPVIVSASFDCSIRFWDLDGHEVIEPLYHDDAVTALAVSETTGGPLLVSGSRDQSVRCWAMSDTGACSCWAESGAHRGWIRALCAGSLAGTGVVVSAGADGELRVWDVERGLPLGAPLVGHDGWVSAVVIVPGPEVIVSAGQDGTARVWHFTAEPAADQASAFAAGVAALAVDARARRALYACGEPPAAVSHLDAGTGELVRVLPAPGAGVRSVCCGMVDDEAVLVSGADDGVVRVTFTGDSRPQLDLRGHVDFVRAVAVAYAGGIGYVVSASDDGTVRVWQPATGQSRVIGYHDDWVRAVAAAPADDGSVIASGSDDATVRLWRLNADGSTEQIAVLVRETPVRAVALDCVGAKLTVASGELSGTVRVSCVDASEIDAPEVAQFHGISGHAGPVAALGIAHIRGRRVCVSGGLEDGYVRVHDLEDEGETRIRVGAQIHAIVIDDSCQIVVATSMGLLALADVMLADGSRRSRETPVREPTDAAAPCPPRLERGGLGGWVWRLEEGLEKAGFPPSGIDGDFGLNTEQALKLFQRSRELPETGSTDVATWAALRPSAHKPPMVHPGR